MNRILLPLCIIAFIAFAEPCLAQTAMRDGRAYKLINKHSGKLLAVLDASRRSGADLTQWLDIDQENVKWRFRAFSAGFWRLINVESAMALSVRDRSRENGAQIIQEELRTNSDSRRWKLEYAGNGYYKLKNKHSGLYIGVRGGRVNNGELIIQWPDEGQENIKWEIQETDQQVTAVSMFKPGALYNLVNRNSGKLLAVIGQRSNTGANVVQWQDDNQDDVKWRIRKSGTLTRPEFSYNIINNNSEKYLAVANKSLDDGGNVIQWDNIGQQDIKWELQHIQNGYYKIRNLHSDKFLAVSNKGLENGANVVQWRDNGQEDVLWRLREVPSAACRRCGEQAIELCERENRPVRAYGVTRGGPCWRRCGTFSYGSAAGGEQCTP